MSRTVGAPFFKVNSFPSDLSQKLRDWLSKNKPTQYYEMATRTAFHWCHLRKYLEERVARIRCRWICFDFSEYVLLSGSLQVQLTEDNMLQQPVTNLKALRKPALCLQSLLWRWFGHIMQSNLCHVAIVGTCSSNISFFGSLWQFQHIFTVCTVAHRCTPREPSSPSGGDVQIAAVSWWNWQASGHL